LAQLYVGILGAATAALVAALALRLSGARWALVAGAVTALLPSQVLWSSLILKDAAVWAVLAGLAVVVSLAAYSTGRRLVALGALAAGLLILLGYLRLPTLEIACVAMVLAMLFSARPQRFARVGGAVAIFVGVTMFFGMGLFGVSFIKLSRDPSLQRSLSALGRSKVVEPTGIATPAKGVVAQVRYLPKGFTVIALRPWPWEASSGSFGMSLARAETILWYPLIALALVGLTTAWRRRAVLAFPILAGGALLVTYGLTEGNLGTAYRHRGEVEWIVILLAVLGLERLAQARSARTVVADPVERPAGARVVPVDRVGASSRGLS
jgi:hypothetical protein